MFRSQATIEYINEKLKATWSPEQIACTPCGLKMPSWRTIYRWIYEKYLVNGNLKVLRRKGKSHGVKETRGKYNKGKSIRKRDKSVYSRKEAGHSEADTVVSGQGKSKACFAALAERKTRFYIAVKMPDRRAETMENAIVSVLSAFPPQLVKTITCGGERNLRTGARSSSGLAAKCILPIRTVRGKRARMKMQTACFERFIRKAEICRVLLLPL